jgi:methionine-S-sulfoxide reductase
MINQPTETNTLVLGGGCFWCTEAIYNTIEGVIEVIPGYTGGETKNPTYSEVCTGETGHAEVVLIKFDPKRVELSQLLHIFFMSHDPTTINRQGADVGSQYRSAIFYSSSEQKSESLKMIGELTKQQAFKSEIVTEVVPLTLFYKAEDYHVNYYSRNKNQGYCRIVIQPKIEKIKKNYLEKQKK